MVYAQNVDDLKEMEVGLKVYHDKILEFMPMIFRDSKGIKTELASEEEWKEFAPPAAPVAATAPVATITMASDQNEMFKVLEASIRQKLEGEIRSTLQAAEVSLEAQNQITQRLKEELEQEEENRHLAIRMALIAEGDKILTQLVMVWQQSKQSGDGGTQWNEVKQRLLELLDATVQLTHS